MNNKKKINNKLLIIIGVVLVLGIGVVLFFINKDENKTLSCHGLQSNDQVKLNTDILIKKIANDIYLNYVGNFEFLTKNELAYNALSVYVENQVKKLKEINGEFAHFYKSENQITYEFDFQMNSLSESRVKELIGIYSYDVEKLKKHFESGGLICEQS